MRAVLVVTLVSLLLTTASAIKFNEDVCYTKNGIDVCFKNVDVVWDEKKVLKYEYEEGKIIRITVSPIPLTDRVYVYLKDDAYYQFDEPEIKIDEIQGGSYDVEVKVIDKDGRTRVDFDLYSDAGYTLYVERVEREEVKIDVSAPEGVIGEPVKITAKVTSGYTGVAKVELSFYVNGSLIGKAKTDSSGKASITYIPDKSGVFDVKVVFNGTRVYSSAEASTELIVEAAKVETTAVTTVTAITTATTTVTPVTLTTVPTTLPATTVKTTEKTPGFEIVEAAAALIAIAMILALKREN